MQKVTCAPKAKSANHHHLLEEWNNLVGKHFSGAKSLGVQHNLGNQLTVRLCHGQAAEQFLQVVWEI